VIGDAQAGEIGAPDGAAFVQGCFGADKRGASALRDPEMNVRRLLSYHGGDDASNAADFDLDFKMGCLATLTGKREGAHAFGNDGKLEQPWLRRG